MSKAIDNKEDPDDELLRMISKLFLHAWVNELPSEIRNIELRGLALENRLKRLFHFLGARTISDLSHASEIDLAKCKNFGSAALLAFRSWLRRLRRILRDLKSNRTTISECIHSLVLNPKAASAGASKRKARLLKSDLVADRQSETSLQALFPLIARDCTLRLKVLTPHSRSAQQVIALFGGSALKITSGKARSTVVLWRI